MREHDLAGAFLRRGWRGGSIRQNPKADPAPDQLNRDFTAAAPNRLWVADATRIVTGEGVLWLAAVRDAFSNRIVGWKVASPLLARRQQMGYAGVAVRPAGRRPATPRTA